MVLRAFRNKACRAISICGIAFTAGCAATSDEHALYTKGFWSAETALSVICDGKTVDAMEFLERNSDVLRQYLISNSLGQMELDFDLNTPSYIGFKKSGELRLYSFSFNIPNPESEDEFLDGGVAVTFNVCTDEPVYVALLVY